MRFSAQLALLFQETLKAWNLKTYLMHSSILDLDILLIVYFLFSLSAYIMYFLIDVRIYEVRRSLETLYNLKCERFHFGFILESFSSILSSSTQENQIPV